MSPVVEAARATNLGAALRALTAESARRFERALEDPESAQHEQLQSVLDSVEGSRQAQGIAGFDRIRNPREFQDAVPLSRPDDFAASIDAMARGEPQVLTRAPVLHFERSGGTSSAAKLVPYTRGLLDEFQAALMPWLHDLASSQPRALAGPGYWSVSPLAQHPAVTVGGHRIGVDDDAYFPGSIRRVLAAAFAVPPRVARLPDVATCRYATLRLLLQCPDLSFASVWNPSFLTLLIDALDRDADLLLDDLATGTCRPPAREAAGNHPTAESVRVRRLLASLPLRADPVRASALRDLLGREHRLPAGELWPKLSLLSVWTDAQAARALAALRARFPGIAIQGKGLLATEGVVSIPWSEAPAPVLAVTSHFLEFIEAGAVHARPRLAHELESDRTYEVVISNRAGLLRYRLGDLVRVVGFHHATPCVRFEGRADSVSDLVGEKLSARRVTAIFAQIFKDRAGDGDRFHIAPEFAMLAPAWGPVPEYHLYLESEAPDALLRDWAAGVEVALLDGYSYEYARSLGQLGPVRAVRVHEAGHRYEARCVALGQRAGDVKPADLDPRVGWEEWMAGTVLNAPSMSGGNGVHS